MRKRLLLNLFKIVGLFGLVFLEWRSGQNSFANPADRSPDPAATPRTLRSLTPAQLEKLIEDLADVSRRSTEEESKRYKLCNDRSNAYLKLSLQQVDPAFKGCAVELLKRTQVPIVLPPTVPEKLDQRPLHAYLYLPSVKVDRYSIGLTWFPREFYQANVAFFEGEKLNANSPTLWEAYEKMSEWGRHSPFFDEKDPGLVNLSQGIEGYFIPSICGANCHSAYDEVIWDQQGYRYKVSIKMGKKAKVLEIADAAIENQLDVSGEPGDDRVQP